MVSAHLIAPSGSRAEILFTNAPIAGSIEGEGVAKKFNVVMKKENLKIIPGDYNVSISSKGISYFKSVNTDLEYWIALEPTSEYGE